MAKTRARIMSAIVWAMREGSPDRTTGSPGTFVDQSCTKPSPPPPASHPSGRTASDWTPPIDLAKGLARAALREDHRRARPIYGPELDLAVFAAAGQPPIRQHRQRRDPAVQRQAF